MGRDLENLFERDVLVRPSDRKPNLVHLIRVISSTCGVEDIQLSQPVQELKQLIDGMDHLVFVLLDGLGLNVFDRLAAGSFLKTHFKRALNATCPSTTACALTTIATAEYPSQHGVVGWFTHLPSHALTATILPFQERFSAQPLVQRGIHPRDVVPLPVVASRMRRKVLTVTPAAIANTPYNDWSRGGTPGAGYQTIPQAIDLIDSTISQATQPTYIHLYLPEIDTVCHKLGVENPSVVSEVMRIDQELGRLASSLSGRSRIVVTADHGLIDVPVERQTLLFSGDSLLELLRVPPTGDARMPIFHVRDGEHESFSHQARERFSDRMIFLPTAECQRLELFGPSPLSEATRQRLGDFVGFPFEAATLAFHAANKPPGHAPADHNHGN